MRKKKVNPILEEREQSDIILLNKIAKRIKKIREGKKVTQEIFYNDTNIHIGRVERGKLNLTISTLNAICNYFGLSLKDFFNELD